MVGSLPVTFLWRRSMAVSQSGVDRFPHSITREYRENWEFEIWKLRAAVHAGESVRKKDWTHQRWGLHPTIETRLRYTKTHTRGEILYGSWLEAGPGDSRWQLDIWFVNFSYLILRCSSLFFYSLIFLGQTIKF